MYPDLHHLTRPHLSICARCDRAIFPLVGGFVHDVRCWGWATAFHNLGMLVRAALGQVELATWDPEDD